MDICQTIYGIAKDIYRLIAKPLRYARSLPEKFTELKERLTNLCRRRADIEAELVRVNQHKAPTSECSGWIEDVGKIEAEVQKIEDQHLVNKRCLKGCFPDVIARARLGKGVEDMIESIKELQEKSKFEGGFVADLPLTIEMMVEKFTELNKQLTTLCRRRDSIKDDIDRVNVQKAPTRECKGWIEDVDKIEIQVKETEEQHLVNKRCLKGCFPDVIAQARLCEDVEKMIKSVEDLHENSKFEAGFLTDLPLAKVEKIPLSDLSMGASTKNTLQKIFERVRDGGTQKIGIWGMGGIGKTTLLKLLNNMPEIAYMFQVVIWVTVSQSWSIRKVQDEIAKRLSLDLGNESDERVARTLLRGLEGKNCLLLLDDVWEFIDLDVVGIPPVNQNKGCKVVLTTRKFEVCRWMHTDAEFKVEALPDEEPRKMFESIVGDVSAMSPKIQEIAQEIVQKCGGLPLAIKVVGGALRKEEDVSVWRNLLRKLKSPDLSYVKDINDTVFASLKASYDHLALHDPNTKNRFLYCGLYPEDHEIKKSRLIKYWKAEGLLSSECTLEEASDEGRALLRYLVDVSLLEKCEDDNHVKLHDVIRDFVLHLTSPKGGEKSRHVVRVGVSKQEMVLLDDKEWEEASRMSFMYASFAREYRLPEMPNCPKLSTLLLQSPFYFSSPLKTIPESFFNLMPNLRVLDLSNSGIRSLPSSISNLVSLRALLLKGCQNLDALPHEIKALKRLEVFEVTGHIMRDLPIEIWELTSLKCLNLMGYAYYVVWKVKIPVGKISKLSQLERFDISRNTFELDEESGRVVGEELSSLTRLSSLVFEFGSINNLEQFVEKSKAWRDQSLRKFKFNVGCGKYLKMRYSSKYKRGLGYDGKRDEGRGIVSSAMREVIKRSERLELQNIRQGLTKLSDLGVGNISGLRACYIQDCDAVETLADEAGLQEDAFVNLQDLNLEDLANLRSIFCCCCEITPPMRIKNMQFKDNFKSLRRLYVYKCPMLKQLFSSWGLLSQLLNLEELYIHSCTRLEEMISVDDDVDDDEITQLEYWTPLPKLNCLHLQNLDEFVCFFSKGNVSRLRWPSLETLHISECPKLKIFPFGAHDDDLQRLEKLELVKLPEFAGFGDGDVSHRKGCWPSLERVRISECPKLKIFPFGAHDDDLQRLRILRIEEVSEFVGFGDGDVSYTSCWPSLHELTLQDCPKLETFPLGPHNLPKLRKLEIHNIPELVSLGEKRNDNDNVSLTTVCWESLQVVSFHNCPKLKIFPFSADTAPNLKRIHSDGPLNWQDDATKFRFSPLMVISSSNELDE